MRCDVSETSGHVTAKSSICAWLTFYKLGVHARKVSCLTLGDLLKLRWESACRRKPLRIEQFIPIAQEKSAEGIVPVITRPIESEVHV